MEWFFMTCMTSFVGQVGCYGRKDRHALMVVRTGRLLWLIRPAGCNGWKVRQSLMVYGTDSF